MSAFTAPKVDFSELHRRQTISKTGIAPTQADVDTVKPGLTWMDPSQRYALVNLANRDLRPKSVYPAFRVIGLFPTTEEAVQFGRRVAPSIPESNIYLVETCKWNLIPQSTDTSPETCFTKLESLLIAYYTKVVLDKLEFDHRRSANTSTVVEQNVFTNPGYTVAVRELEKRGVALESIHPQLEDRLVQGKQELFEKLQSSGSSGSSEQKSDTAATAATADTAAPVNKDKVEFTETMLRADEDTVSLLPDNQRFILFSVMEDDNEPAFCLYAALPTLQESKGYQHFVLKTDAPTHDNNCGDLGRWIYPESVREMDKYGLSTYPVDEQNRIMKWHHSNKNQSYNNMPGIDILADRRLDENGNIVDRETKEE